MRLVLVSLLLATGCKAGELTDQSQTGLAKPVESQADDRTPLPGEGAASPTSALEDTPAPAKTEEEIDSWSETSTDPWAPTSQPDEVTATPALPDQAEPDPWAPTSTDPWAPAKQIDKTTKREKQPLR
jgi:hypothetical protein